MFNINQLFNGAEMMRPFNTTYRCYSTGFLANNRPEIERGGKIILPPSALDHLTRLHIEYPMLFKLTNVDPNKQRTTHCGVLEFVAEEGKCHIPYWMMKNLLLSEGDMVQIQNISLPQATHVKLQPQHVDFLNISNPRAVLEVQLRGFACLTKGDVIAINYNDKTFEFEIIELKPGNAVSIIECDLNVDFAPPLGYVEPVAPIKKSQPEAVDIELPPSNEFKPFKGEGRRLDGKAISKTDTKETQIDKPRRGIPNYNYKPGKLTFMRIVKPTKDSKEEQSVPQFSAFSGPGQKLKGKR